MIYHQLIDLNKGKAVEVEDAIDPFAETTPSHNWLRPDLASIYPAQGRHVVTKVARLASLGLSYDRRRSIHQVAYPQDGL